MEKTTFITSGGFKSHQCQQNRQVYGNTCMLKTVIPARGWGKGACGIGNFGGREIPQVGTLAPNFLQKNIFKNVHAKNNQFLGKQPQFPYSQKDKITGAMSSLALGGPAMTKVCLLQGFPTKINRWPHTCQPIITWAAWSKNCGGFTRFSEDFDRLHHISTNNGLTEPKDRINMEYSSFINFISLANVIWKYLTSLPAQNFLTGRMRPEGWKALV